MADILDLVLPVEWPFPPLVDIPAEDRPRVAMHIARAFREEARRWEQQALRVATEANSLSVEEPRARRSKRLQTLVQDVGPRTQTGSRAPPP